MWALFEGSIWLALSVERRRPETLDRLDTVAQSTGLGELTSAAGRASPGLPDVSEVEVAPSASVSAGA
jgi:hypothetical protein